MRKRWIITVDLRRKTTKYSIALGLSTTYLKKCFLKTKRLKRKTTEKESLNSL